MRIFGREWFFFFYQKTRAALKTATILKIIVLWRTYVRHLWLTIPILILPALFAYRRARFPLVLMIVFMAALSIEKGTLSHYTAPMAGTFFLLFSFALRWLRTLKPAS